jgi:metal-responsive CopG/Arc/MetJ family transcriptional regulator
MNMNNRIPDEDKRIKISISIDPHLNKKLQEIAVKNKFYKKSRLVEYLIKKYIEENDN